MITAALLTDIKNQFLIDWFGIHGVYHWARVYAIGMKLTDQTDAHRTVVQLFSLFHDAGRHNEGADPAHGPRGAKLAENYRDTHLKTLSTEEFELLTTACRLHTSELSHHHITVQTCFDADRLDLGRIGTLPDPQYLCTEAAKSAKMISWALENSRLRKIPQNIVGQFAQGSRTKIN